MAILIHTFTDMVSIRAGSRSDQACGDRRVAEPLSNQACHLKLTLAERPSGGARAVGWWRADTQLPEEAAGSVDVGAGAQPLEHDQTLLESIRRALQRVRRSRRPFEAGAGGFEGHLQAGEELDRSRQAGQGRFGPAQDLMSKPFDPRGERHRVGGLIWIVLSQYASGGERSVHFARSDLRLSLECSPERLSSGRPSRRKPGSARARPCRIASLEREQRLGEVDTERGAAVRDGALAVGLACRS
jgi:hypothetical protein